MGVKNPGRLVAVVGPAAVAALLLGACGGSDDASGSSRTTFDLSATAFATLPPETTTTTVAGQIPEQSGSTGEQEYTIQAGDVPVNVANRFGITVEDIGDYNGWAACSATSCPEWPFPGNVIRIPPGATPLNPPSGGETDPGVEVVTGGEDEQPDADTGGDTEGASDGDDGAATETGGDETPPAGDTIPEAGDNCGPGVHVVEEGDIPLRLVEIYDVTLEALDAANADNPAYGRFVPGDEIIIPARDDC